MIIAVTSENNQVFGHFGRTPEFTVFEVENGKIERRTVVSTNGTGHGALAGFLADRGVELLICGGIGAGAQQALFEQGIKLVGGVSGEVDEVVRRYLDGTLEFDQNFQCHDHHHGSEGEHHCNCGRH